MSATTASFTDTVHVRLLDEGVDVWRPVKARALGGSVYELANDRAPAGESWEFAPGATVSVEARTTSAGTTLVAVKRAKSEARR